MSRHGVIRRPEPVKCARPNCITVFVPRNDKHIYCSATCKKRCHTYRHVLNLPARGN